MPTKRQRRPPTMIISAHWRAGPRAISSRSMSFSSCRLVLARLGQRRRGDAEPDAGDGRDPEGLRRAPLAGRQRCIEATLVPEVRFRAAEAAVAGLDREAG